MTEHVSQDKSSILALFCPACPQPGVNLPTDWDKDSKWWLYIRKICADGNFKADHLNQINPGDDVQLTEGEGFMTGQEKYSEHIKEASAKAPQFKHVSYCFLMLFNTFSIRNAVCLTVIGAECCHRGLFGAESLIRNDLSGANCVPKSFIRGRIPSDTAEWLPKDTFGSESITEHCNRHRMVRRLPSVHLVSTDSPCFYSVPKTTFTCGVGHIRCGRLLAEAFVRERSRLRTMQSAPNDMPIAFGGTVRRRLYFHYSAPNIYSDLLSAPNMPLGRPIGTDALPRIYIRRRRHLFAALLVPNILSLDASAPNPSFGAKFRFPNSLFILSFSRCH